jgi:hypothetical protein
MGIAGLWFGYSIACIILDLGFGCIILCPNWKKIGMKMQKELADTSMSPMLSPLMPRSVSPLINKK